MFKNFKRHSLGSLFILSFAFASYAASAEYKIKIAHASPAVDDRLERSVQEFKANIEKRTNGEVVISTYPASQLGGEREQLEGVQLGSIEMAILAGPVSSIYPEILVFDLPYLFKSNEVAYEVLDGEFGQKILDGMLPKTGVRALAWGETGFRHFTSSNKEISGPDDLKGLKIRTMENPAHMTMVKSLGASATPMAFGEVYSALQQGVIDGQENPISLIESMRFYEVQKHLTLDGHVYNPYTFLVNEAYFSKLPKEYQDIIQEEAKNWSDLERKLNIEQENNGLQKLKDYGMQIRALSNEEKEAFRQATQPVYDMYREQLGDEIINDLLKAVEEAEAKFSSENA